MTRISINFSRANDGLTASFTTDIAKVNAEIFRTMTQWGVGNILAAIETDIANGSQNLLRHNDLLDRARLGFVELINEALTVRELNEVGSVQTRVASNTQWVTVTLASGQWFEIGYHTFADSLTCEFELVVSDDSGFTEYCGAYSSLGEAQQYFIKAIRNAAASK